SPLIEQHDAIDGRIEETPALRIGATTWAAMQKDHRLAVRVATLLVVQRMQRGDLEKAAVERLDLGIQRTKLRRHDDFSKRTDKPTRLARGQLFQAHAACVHSLTNSLPGLRMPFGSNTFRT